MCILFFLAILPLSTLQNRTRAAHGIQTRWYIKTTHVQMNGRGECSARSIILALHYLTTRFWMKLWVWPRFVTFKGRLPVSRCPCHCWDGEWRTKSLAREKEEQVFSTGTVNQALGLFPAWSGCRGDQLRDCVVQTDCSGWHLQQVEGLGVRKQGERWVIPSWWGNTLLAQQGFKRC